ncbi:MAG: NTP transferase domain-containing protein [Nitrososphaerota archaeon]|nr:NTP transferase domain-containing protein [Candidatus Calditenuaceae archaeon]MDW8073046.1 NTP transferase domain-containing protein [Nitrososphaerota archaeon]
MASTAIIITGFKEIGGVRRGLYRLFDRPMIEYVLDALPDEVDELVLSVPDEAGRVDYSETAEKYVANIHLSSSDIGGVLKSYMPLSKSDRFLVFPCDAPLLTREFTTFILETLRKFSAAIPRDADGRAEYLFSGYRKGPFLEACDASGSEEIAHIVKHVKNALYIYIEALRVFDTKMNIFFRVTNSTDARRAERIISNRLKDI